MRLVVGAVVVSARSTVPAGFEPLITSYCFTVITCNQCSILVLRGTYVGACVGDWTLKRGRLGWVFVYLGAGMGDGSKQSGLWAFQLCRRGTIPNLWDSNAGVSRAEALDAFES